MTRLPRGHSACPLLALLAGASPTAFGRNATGERFAECFLLHKLDRPALDRAAPAVGRWFDSPEPAALLQK